MTAPLRLGQSEPVRAEGASVSGVHVLAGTALTVLWTGSLVDLLRRGPSWALVHLTVLGTLLLAGAVVLRSTGHGRRISLVLLAAGVASALAQGLGTYGETSSPGAAAASWFAAWQWPLFVVPLLTLVPLRYPDGRLPGQRWRLAETSSWGAVLLLVGGAATSPSASGTARGEAVSELLFAAGSAAWAGAAGAALASLAVRWRRGSAEVRAAVLLLGTAVGTGVAVYVVQPVLPPAGFQLAALLWPAAVVLALVVGVRRYGDGGDRVVRGGAVLAALAALGFLLYGAVVALLAAVAAPLPGAVASAVAVALVLLGLEPARRRVRRLLVRALRGDRDQPLRALADLRRRLAEAQDHDEVLAAVPPAVVKAVRAPYAGLLVRHDGELQTVAESGRRPQQWEDHPLVHRREHIGVLRVGLRGAGGPYDAAEHDLLAQLAHDAAATAAAVRLQEELRAARWQLVQATAEERDRLRRDLHDGLGPLLSGAGLALEGIRQQLDQTSPTAAHVQAVGTSVRAAAGEVRRVLDGLAPEALSDHDLAAAVEQHLADVRRGGLHADLEACTGPLPPVVQEAAYRLVLEAVTNVVRHARAQHVHVRLVREGHDVVVEVRDDGRGMPPSYVSGVGIDSMRRRAGELGGSLLVDASVPHGTLVRARLPVAP